MAMECIKIKKQTVCDKCGKKIAMGELAFQLTGSTFHTDFCSFGWTSQNSKLVSKVTISVTQVPKSMNTNVGGIAGFVDPMNKLKNEVDAIGGRK